MINYLLFFACILSSIVVVSNISFASSLIRHTGFLKSSLAYNALVREVICALLWATWYWYNF